VVGHRRSLLDLPGRPVDHDTMYNRSTITAGAAARRRRPGKVVKTILDLFLPAGTALALGGCVASMAASAVGMAAQGAMGRPTANEQMQPAAANACSASVSKYGVVHLIDVEQRTSSKIVVWGIVDDGKTRCSFECAYGTKITALKLSPIKTAG
jgi:hypothetical protein